MMRPERNAVKAVVPIVFLWVAAEEFSLTRQSPRFLDIARKNHANESVSKLDIAIISKQIDAEISSRSSNKFGIKVGGELYKELAKAGKIKKVTFSAFGTGAFPEKLPAYDGKIFIYVDWELPDDAYVVGTPDP